MRDQIAARVADDFQGAGVVVLHGRRRTVDPSHNEHLEALAGSTSDASRSALWMDGELVVSPHADHVSSSMSAEIRSPAINTVPQARGLAARRPDVVTMVVR